MKVIIALLLLLFGNLALDVYVLVQGNDLAEFGVRAFVVLSLTAAGVMWEKL